METGVAGGFDDEQFEAGEVGIFRRGGGGDDGAGGRGGVFRRLRIPGQGTGVRRPFVPPSLLQTARRGVFGAEHEDVGHDDFVGRDLLRVFEDGGRRFRVEAAEVFVFGVVCLGVGGAGCGSRGGGRGRRGCGGGGGRGGAGGHFRLFGLLEGLREGGLAGARGTTVGADLGPAFAEEVAEFPAGLDGGAEEFFVGGFAVSLVLAQAEEHFGQGPTGSE